MLITENYLRKVVLEERKKLMIETRPWDIINEIAEKYKKPKKIQEAAISRLKKFVPKKSAEAPLEKTSTAPPTKQTFPSIKTKSGASDKTFPSAKYEKPISNKHAWAVGKAKEKPAATQEPVAEPTGEKPNKLLQRITRGGAPSAPVSTGQASAAAQEIANVDLYDMSPEDKSTVQAAAQQLNNLAGQAKKDPKKKSFFARPAVRKAIGALAGLGMLAGLGNLMTMSKETGTDTSRAGIESSIDADTNVDSDTYRRTGAEEADQGDFEPGVDHELSRLGIDGNAGTGDEFGVGGETGDEVETGDELPGIASRRPVPATMRGATQDQTSSETTPAVSTSRASTRTPSVTHSRVSKTKPADTSSVSINDVEAKVNNSNLSSKSKKAINKELASSMQLGNTITVRAKGGDYKQIPVGELIEKALAKAEKKPGGRTDAVGGQADLEFFDTANKWIKSGKKNGILPGSNTSLKAILSTAADEAGIQLEAPVGPGGYNIP